MNDLFTEDDRRKILALKTLADNFFWTALPGNTSYLGILAGGAFASWYKSETPRDYDVFFLDNDEEQKLRRSLDGDGNHAGLLVQKSISNYASNPHIKEIFIPGKRYFQNPVLEKNCQFIFTDFKTREELIDSFDYWHCRVCFVRDRNKERGGTLYISPEAFEHIRKKTLKRTKSPYWAPQREKKFLERGWKPWNENTTLPPVSGVSVGTIASNGIITSITVSAGGTGYVNINDEWKEIVPTQNLLPPNYNEEIAKVLHAKKQLEMEIEEIKKLEAAKSKTWLEEFTEKLKKPWDSF